MERVWFCGCIFPCRIPGLQIRYLAIDQGPQIIMIENYRSGLLWNLFTSCPEVKAGMKAWDLQHRTFDYFE